jgi:hypothetical protein
MVDVTDRAHIAMRLGASEFLFGHGFSPAMLAFSRSGQAYFA